MTTEIELQILRKAQELKEDPLKILLELNIPNNSYTLFVYDVILLKGKDTVENILKELKLVNTPEIIKALEIIDLNHPAQDIYSQDEMFFNDPKPELPIEWRGQDLEESVVIEILDKMGVRYLEPFILSLSNLFGDDDLMIVSEIEEHPFEPFVPDNATILIIGSFPGMEQGKDKSKIDEWFYTAPDNLFWNILSSVYEKELTTTKAKKELFSNVGIGITDIFLKVRRKKGVI